LVKLLVDDVTFIYPGNVLALDEVTLAVAPGEMLALIGENGAGKSTLARHLNGLLKPGQGRVLVGDWDTGEHTVAQLAHRVGLAFQNPDDQLFARTVRDEVAFGPRNLGRSETATDAAVEAALEQVGLSHRAAAHPYDLSVAERKLVTLAAILAMDTPILVIDEPTTGQDATGIERVGAILQKLKSEGRTVIAITHDMEFCADHFGRVVVMADGRIIADGDADDILCQTELLARADVRPPQLVQLAQALGLPHAPLTESAFLDLYEEERQ
jgi:energy-coupling factor transport system ATP-binding protein